ncbi:hypothetical protein Barb6XT_01745 [Bacteroidales bacterium Barb6XT]|nr:hypothetical protein Barb6XT_01745 [Bacteroidales bacterium Barb6XT]
MILNGKTWFTSGSWKADETENIKGADRWRDEALARFRMIADAGLLSNDETEKSAAKKIKMVLDKYRNANLKPYAENSALVI